ncbi:hypothetical protein CUC00_08315 [Prevotella intermedia]|uniref:DUF5675 family protein n=1 Tax=Prevotella intermedia TaxID=28131 RepID=UPI000C1BD4F2|nr:DUF5675 family protein [Prevotella intermedia]ATV32558.1 hypothetical protein CTM44_01625 [Prevotella intermedia]ATV41032.1 hypothetical protein CUC00_08315 [Prevotella intermedia]
MGNLNLRVERKWKKKDYTIGNLYIDGVFFSNVLEDTVRGLHQDMTPEEIQKIKVYGETAIPSGKYEVRITMSSRFRCPLPLLVNVPGYEGIRIHAGNTARDTHGCLLPGKNSSVGQVSNSRATMNVLQKRIEDTIAQGGKVFIQIDD